MCTPRRDRWRAMDGSVRRIQQRAVIQGCPSGQHRPPSRIHEGLLRGRTGPADYHVRAARGDFCLPGAIEYAGEAFQDCREIVELLLRADLIAVPRALPGLTRTDKRAGSVYQPSDRAQALMKLEALDSFTGGDSEFTGHRRSVSRRMPQTTTKRAADGTYQRV